MQLQDRPHTEAVDTTATPTQNDSAAGAAASDTPELPAHGLYRLGFGYGRLVYRLRWLVLALWLVGLGASIPFASQLGSVLSGGGYSFNASESVQAANIATDEIRQPATQVVVVFQSADTPVADPAYQDELTSFVARANDLAQFSGATPGPVGADGKTTFVTLSAKAREETVEQELSDVRAILPASGPAKAYITGSPAIYNEFTHLTQEQTRSAEEAALPIALVVLVIVFGTLVAAAMPLVLALVAVPVALAIIYAIATQQQTSVFVLSIASIIGLGISIDYSLFLVRRFREELARGRSVPDAVGWTVATAGEAILFSGLTVMIGFGGLIIIGIQFMTSMGIGGATVVAVAVLGALTLVPALLGILGPRVNALRIPVLGRLVGAASHDEERSGGFWRALATGVMRRPVLIVLGVAVLLVGLGWPIFSLKVGTPGVSELPSSSEARQGADILSAQFPQTAGTTLQVVVQTSDRTHILEAQNLAKLDALTRWLGTQSHVTGVVSLTQLPPNPANPAAPALTSQQLIALYTSGAFLQNPSLVKFVSSTSSADATIITVQSDAALDSDAAASLVNSVRAHKDEARGLLVYVGGAQALQQDFDGYLYGNFPRAIAFILLATFVVLLLMFRSLLLPLKAILMNVLSVSAAYGVLVFVFQEGHFENILNFQSSGYLDSTTPILLFCVLFGLSMDYEVFLLSRIREEWLRTHDNRYAVARGLEKTGGVITSAALLFVIVAGAFAFTGIITTKEIGLGMSVAVLVDAAIIRTLLVPATMRLVGRWNWWLPGRPLPPKQLETH